MTTEEIDAAYAATMRAHRKVLIWAMGALLFIVGAGVALFLWVMSPAQTPEECVADAVATYVENQAHGPIVDGVVRPWTVTEEGKAAAADDARAACQRFAG